MKMIKLASIYSLVFMTGVSLYAQSTNEIIDRYFEKVGDGWKELKSVQFETYVWMNLDIHGSMLDDVTGSAPMDVHEDYIEYPDKQKRVIYRALQDKGTTYNVKGKRFLITQGLKRETRPMPLFKFNPMKILECQNEGKLTTEGANDHYKLSCKTEDFHHYFFINKQTYLIDFYRPADRPDLITYLSDYQLVDGHMVPFKKEMKRDGVTFFKSEIQEVKINPAFNAGLFLIPN